MKSSFLISLALVLILGACNKAEIPKVVVYPDMAEAQNPALLTTVGSVNVSNGGFGSSIVADPNDPEVFYLLTDRGPNIDGTILGSKVFAVPNFVPQIGKFRLTGDKLILEQTITLKNAVGGNLNGLPNPIGVGNTGELPLDITGKTLATSVDGIDCEGMAIAPDGSFWISDEYGPHILHVDATGKTIERINPFGSGTGGRSIPKVFATRRANRGMEGLTITPDGKTLVGMMQFPLFNPSSAAISGSLLIRIITFDIATAATKQYVYVMDAANLQAVSEIAAITNTTFMVIERDAEFPTEANKATVVKKIYKIDISGATDVSDPANGANGKLFGGKTLEELKTSANLQANSIVPVSKSLISNLMVDTKTLYPHDKAEGVIMINPNLIAVCNDDDFGVVGVGTYTKKSLAGLNNEVDRNRIYFIKLTTPLK